MFEKTGEGEGRDAVKTMIKISRFAHSAPRNLEQAETRMRNP
jgi:hypothetical protein